MKKTTFTLLLFLSCCRLAAQCPTGDVTFSAQGQVDSFQIIYPGCTSIPGNVKLNGPGITNLQGLSELKVVEGKFEILSTGLTSLDGLNNIDSILGGFRIQTNPNLLNLHGMGSLVYIGTSLHMVFVNHYFSYSLWVEDNPVLATLSGISSLKAIDFFRCAKNDALASLNGLENLQSIYNVDIFDTFLISLNGLENIDSIGGYFSLSGNDSLVSLSGLENLQSLGALWIEGTNSLTSFSKLENLQSLGELVVRDNSSLTSISGLENIDSLPVGISIDNTALTSLNGLKNIHHIGEVHLFLNALLSNLNGLENIDTIHGSLDLNSTSLTSLKGLENIVSIRGDLRLNNNDNLTSLKELESLQSIGVPGFSTYVYIGYNSNLTALSGLENADFSMETNLVIVENPKLSFCSTQSICQYFENGGGASISNNAPGCDNVPQVRAACLVSIEETSTGEPVLILSPNPAANFLQIQINDGEKWEITLCNLQGRPMFRQVVSSGSQIIDVKDWPSGSYALRAVSGGRAYAGRLIKQ